MALLASTAPQPTRRSARNQSREPESAPPSSPVKGRRPAKRARSASANVESAPDESNEVQASHVMNNLDAVPEESQELRDDADMVFVNHHAQQSPGHRSTLSGTTAHDPRSVTEVELLQHDGRSEELPSAIVDLTGRATSVINILAPKGTTIASVQELTNELQKSDSLLSKRLHSRELSLKESVSRFTNDQYIWPEYVLKATLNLRSTQDIGHGHWRPDGVLQKANLAVLATSVVPQPDRFSIGQLFLKQLDSVFPAPFISAFANTSTNAKNVPAGQSKHKDQTFEMALSLRTQVAIALLEFGSRHHQHTFDPDTTLHGAFLPLDGEKPHPWSIRMGGKAAMLTADHQKSIVARMNKIRDAFSPHNSPQADPVDFEVLEAEFPWTSFKQQLVQWIRLRNTEIDTNITACNGVDEISAKWETEVVERAKEAPDAPFTSATAEGIKILRNKRKQSTKRQKTSIGESTFAPSASEQDEDSEPRQRARGYVPEDIPVDPQLQSQQQEAAQQVYNRTLARSLLDSQPGATRVIFDDTQGSQTPRSPLKRRRDAEDIAEEDATQDAGFQNDERGPGAAEQRRQEVHLVQQAQQAQASHQNEDQQLGQQLGEAMGPDYQAMDDIQNTPAPLTQGEIYRNQVQPRAKAMTTIRSIGKPPQQRKGWTVAECTALIDLIAKDLSYAAAKKRDESGANILVDRDAEAMRHKARNMKFDYLKSGIPLPQGFDRVLLDKKFQDRLAALRVVYHQDQARAKRVTIGEEEEED